ncbi:SGNH/GDSL hydrolase family protein [Corynebacterium phoceense]|uniref:SGNH/GDSL hydrolase family protein n=1 Tax=Corynebacterium phoceense TaxID=1686286 RepID=UPI0034CE4162
MRRLPLAVLVVAALTGCSSTSAEPIPEPEPLNYAALGDSYAAMGSRAATADDDPCMVAEDSYPVLLAEELDAAQFTIATCQGAVTADVGEKTASGTAASEGSPQVAALGEETDLVTLSIGGNDVSFIDMTRCFENACPAGLREKVAGELGELPARLDDVYAAIEQQAPDAQVFATGYLPLLNEGCTNVPDAAWLAEQINRINGEVRAAAERHGATYVMPAGVEEHTGCSAEPWVDFTGEATGSYPMHPTAAGQHAMAEAIAAAVG